MADNVTLDPGSGGAVIATDDDGTAQHQYVKVEFGGDGTFTKVTSAVGLPVSDAGGSLTVDGTVTAELSATDNAVLDAIEADTTTIAGAVKAEDAAHTTADTGIPALAVRRDTPTSLAGTDNDYLPLTTNARGAAWVAVDDTVSVSIDDAGGSLTVDGSVTVNAGTNLNTSALALESGGNLAAQTTALQIIDDWDETDRAKVNIIAGQAGVAAGAGAVGATVQRVTLASDDPAVTALQVLDNAISGSEMQVDVVAALPAGNNNIGDVDVASIAAGTNAIGNVGLIPRTSGGLTIFRSIDLDETEEEIKATAGQLFGWYIFNAAATTRYVKLYNATAASVTVGSTTPVLTIPVPAGAAANVFSEVGIAFSTAITAAATTGVADADTGAPSANDVIVNFFYA